MKAEISSYKTDVYRTDVYRTGGALLLAPVLTGLSFTIALILYFITDHYLEKGNLVVNEVILVEYLPFSWLVTFIAAGCTLIFGLPLHLFLAHKQNMCAKYYCIAGFLLPSPLLLIALEEGLAALYILVLNFCGLLCSWLFWLIAVKNNKAWFQKFSKKLVSIFE